MKTTWIYQEKNRRLATITLYNEEKIIIVVYYRWLRNTRVKRFTFHTSLLAKKGYEEILVRLYRKGAKILG